MQNTSFISTTIPYVNARPHLGHALEFVQTDAFARFIREQRDEVFFLTGSDENSLKNVLAAEAEGITARELVDRNVVYFEELLGRLGSGHDHFVRTSVDELHRAGATAIWQRMAEAGDIYSQAYEGLYCVGCEQFYEPEELVDGLCPEHLVRPEPVREENYFFRLSRYQDQLLDALTSGRLRIAPESRMNEIVSFVRGGLKDISISRSSARARGWGIPVPGDPDQVMYVWIDALTNYVNALGWTADDERYRRFWAEATDRIHVMGKGVIRFHAVYWPAMLLSAGLPLPTQLVVHGYITAGGRKIGKSLGNAVDPNVLLDKYGANALRYALLADVPPFGDSDFSDERLVARYNTDLANGLGNLVNRVTSMIGRYRDGRVPTPGEPGDPERGLAEQVRTTLEQSHAAMVGYDHRLALQHVTRLVGRCNAYIDELAPWHLAKAEKNGEEGAAARLDTCLHHTVAAIRVLGALMRPFLPEASAQILTALRQSTSTTVTTADWLDGLAGSTVDRPEVIFPRLEVAD
jgi:methionyl-tRNA synthetase